MVDETNGQLDDGTLYTITKQVLIECGGSRERALPVLIQRYAETPEIHDTIYQCVANHMMSIVQTNQRKVIATLSSDDVERVAKARAQNFRALAPAAGYRRGGLTEMSTILLDYPVPYAGKRLGDASFEDLKLAQTRIQNAISGYKRACAFINVLLENQGNHRDSSNVINAIGIKRVVRLHEETRPVVIDAETVPRPHGLSPGEPAA